MSRRRPGISAGVGRVSWAARRMVVDHAQAEREAAAAREQFAELPARVHHPAVCTTHSRWYRVIRIVMDVDHYTHVEDIGEFPSQTDAILFSTREDGHARVMDAHGKTISTNGQPIQQRTA